MGPLAPKRGLELDTRNQLKRVSFLPIEHGDGGSAEEEGQGQMGSAKFSSAILSTTPPVSPLAPLFAPATSHH